MTLKLNSDHCIGCRLCQLACSAQKEGVFNPDISRLKIVSMYDKTGLEIKSAICTLCLACVDVCTTEAITFENGHLAYDQDQCTNCGLCVAACPEQVIRAQDNGVAVCDLCQGSPTCVKWCPHQALTNVEVI